MNCIQKWKQYRLRRKILKSWFSGDIDRDQLTAEQHQFVQTATKNRIKRIRRRFRRRVRVHDFIRSITIKPIGRLLRPLPVKWQEEYYDGVLYPHCPACGELAYEKDHCVFCGRRFSKWDDQP